MEGMTAASGRTTDPGGRDIRLIRHVSGLNLGLVALQPISAGLLMSGYGRALPVHAVVGLALQLGALVQVGAAIVLWRRRHVPPWVAAVSIGFFVVVFLQNAFGHYRQYWLHVPIGVALFGALVRQGSRLVTLSRTSEPRS